MYILRSGICTYKCSVNGPRLFSFIHPADTYGSALVCQASHKVLGIKGWMGDVMLAFKKLTLEGPLSTEGVRNQPRAVWVQE